MKKLIYAEWYKLLNSRVSFIIAIGITVQTFLQVLAGYVDAQPTLGSMGVAATANMSFVLQMWLTAFTAYFIASEFQNGAMRNILALGNSRVKVYLSKLFSTFVTIAAIYLIITILLTMGFSPLFGFGDMDIMEYIRFFSSTFLMQVFFHFIFAAIFTMFAFLSRSLGMTAILGFGFIILMVFIPGILDLLGISFVTEYLPVYFISSFSKLSGDTGFLTKGILVTLGYLVLTSVIGIIAFKKSDIK